MRHKLAVIGVGNMAKAIIGGIVSSEFPIDEIVLFDKNTVQYEDLSKINFPFRCAKTISDAIEYSDCVLLAVKPQNYEEVLEEISNIPNHSEKLYISIGAGITSKSVSERLSSSPVIRVLPNVPMMIGQGVSVICENPAVAPDDFTFVCSIFECAGSILRIDESEMNRIIGVTSSSPAYVFQLIHAIHQGALAQGLVDRHLLDAICDVVIGSALMLKQSKESPTDLIAKVASKGGTTEQALKKLEEYRMNDAICEAMKACTNRADELANS